MLNNSTPTNTSYTHDNDNRVLTAGNVSFSYDNNGNLVTKTVGGNVTNYSWDFNDMLTQVANGGNTYVYRYDGLGNRVARIENGAEKRYVGGLAETDVSGNITAYYVHGLGLISKVTPTNQSYYYHYDGIGSTIGMSDSTGSIVNKYAYDSFGKVLSEQEGIPNPFKYVGQFGVMDEENGLLYMRARYYDPEAGRFISKDPIGFTGGLNLYSYVRNEPIGTIDPSGLDVVFIGIGLSGHTSKSPFSPKSKSGYAVTASIGIAYDTVTKGLIIYTSGGAADPSSGDIVKGGGIGVGPLWGRVWGGMNDFLGCSREYTGYNIISSFTEIETGSGKQGLAQSAGGRGWGVGFTSMDTNTSLLIKLR